MEHKFKNGDRVKMREGKSSYCAMENATGVFNHYDDMGDAWFFPDKEYIFDFVEEVCVVSGDLEPEHVDGWIEWNGGDCPVAAGTFTEVKFRDGSTALDSEPEDRLWRLNGRIWDIIAYRIVKEATTDSDDPRHNVVMVDENICTTDFREDVIPGTAMLDNIPVAEFMQEDIGSAATSKHYNSMSVQPIEVWQMVLTPEEFIGALKSQVMKYSIRAGSKAGESSEKDDRKASQYKMWLELAKQGKTIDPRVDVV